MIIQVGNQKVLDCITSDFDGDTLSTALSRVRSWINQYGPDAEIRIVHDWESHDMYIVEKSDD